MNRTSRFGQVGPLAIALAGISFATFVTSAEALLITNLNTNQVIFSDDFESGTPGANPVANVGSWELVGFGAPVGVTVSDAAAPGPNQGEQYLHMQRQQPPFYPDVALRANASVPQATSGDIIRLEFAAYQSSYPNQSNTYIINPIAPLTGREYVEFGVFPDGTKKPISISGVVNAALSAEFELDTWQNWIIDFELGTNNTTWTLDGTTVTTTTPPNGTHVSFEEFVIDLGGDDVLYIDATRVVPEPSTILCMSIGAIGLAVGRVRRRK